MPCAGSRQTALARASRSHRRTMDVWRHCASGWARLRIDSARWITPSAALSGPLVSPLCVFEIAVGTMLLLNRWLRIALVLFAAQMLGTFLVFVILPEVAFRHGNPL